MASANPPIAVRIAFETCSPRAEPDLGWARRTARPPALLRLMRLLAGGQRDFRHTPAIERDPGVLSDRVGVGIGQRLMGGDAVLIPAGDLVALLIGQELLDRVGLLNVGGHPIANPLPRGIGVGAEYELADAGRYFEQLRAGSMSAEGRMNLDARQDLRLAVDDHGLAVQHLAVDLAHSQRRIPAGRGAHAAAGRGVDSGNLR